MKEFVRRTFGIEATGIEELVSYEDRNYLVTTPDQKCVLKINRAERDVLEAQNEAMERASSALEAPRLIKPMVETQEGWARLLTYVEGEFMVKVEQMPSLLKSLGFALARLDRALLDFRHVGAHRHLRWDLRRLPRTTDHIEEPRIRSITDYFIEQFADHEGLRESVIHNDANDHNLLVRDGAITGIIDFGDLVHTHTLFELAIALAYVMLDKEDPLQAAATVVGAYHENLPLTEREIELLFPAVCARLAMSVNYASESPGDAYVNVSQRPVRELMLKLIAASPDRARDLFRQACGLTEVPRTYEKTLHARQRLIGPALSLNYQKPLKIVRGAMQYLFDEEGRSYLDCVNNVCHIGHCHPAVVRAANRQMRELNTNTRYLHDLRVRYAERLTATLPDPLSVVIFTNSGSEANDLAARLARAHTGRRDMIVVDQAYHGNTTTAMELSPYKGDTLGPGVHKIPMPTVGGPEHLKGIEAAAFIVEPILSCGGQIVPPGGWLREAFGHVRERGGLCIADEVQTGFGRVGSHWWAFELQGVVPDIVTMGKPMGNGHPIGAVVTTPEIARAIKVEYFNTFGGNPVSCAVGLAVLDAIERDKLRENALKVGARLKEKLGARGHGLFLGVDRPDAPRIVEALKEQGILLSVDGPNHDVIKIKPPLPFSEADADRLVEAFTGI